MPDVKKSSVRVRFAPSPTGYLHIGNVRTALFNWLFARKSEADFILRIEDTDSLRSREDYVESIVEDLSRFGLDWDEGPDVGGSSGPYRQSQRIGLYAKHLEALLKKGSAYECFCLPEELDAMRKEQAEQGKTIRYSGKCFHLSDEEKRKLRSEGRQPSYRFRVENKQVVVRDLIRGDVTFDTSTIGDFIIMKSDGWPSFHFAVAVDDGEMKITHVIRGEDHLTNTPKHIMILESLGFDPPRYAHLPMIMGQDHQPLSKRHGHVSIRDYLDEGYLPEALMNYLALLGWSSGDNQEIFSSRELIKRFELASVNKSAAVFDNKKLDWISMQHMKEIPDVKLTQMVIPYLKAEEGLCSRKHINEEMFDYLKKMINVLRPYLSKLKDINEYADIFLCQQVRLSEEAGEILRTGNAKKISEIILENLEDQAFDEKEFHSILNKVKRETGLKGKDLFMPIRAVLTGRLSGPELVEVFPLLDKNVIRKRLESALKI